MCQFADKLFSDTIWLPGNLTWSDLKNQRTEENLPNIVLSVPLAFLLLVLRYCCEKFCFAPIGSCLSIQGAKIQVPPNHLLKEALIKRNTYDKKQIQGWAKQLDWSEKEVEQWLKSHTRHNKPTTLTKFCESTWRFTYYFSAFTFGLIVLWDKPWLWDIQECWRSYPYQERTAGTFWYYSISLAFYCSLSLSQFFDIKRKDFWQMFVHHIATISLIVLSWTVQLHRIGTVILLLHDFADILLEAAKITKYCGLKRTCEVIFVIFTFCWLLSRMIVFPFWILKSTMFDVLQYHTAFAGYYIFNSFLLVLFLLNILWTYLLLKLIYKVLRYGDDVEDVRSDSEED